MNDSEKMKIDNEGNFYKWETKGIIVGRVEKDSPTPTKGLLSGYDFEKLLKPYIDREVRVTIEIKKES
jgi:hypothetical protein